MIRLILKKPDKMNFVFTKPDGYKLFLGGVRAAKDWELMEENDITGILSVFNGEPPKFQNINIKLIYVADVVQQDIKQYFEEAFEFINSNKNVLVHCHAGRSRSAAFVIGYIMETTGADYEQAYELVNSRRFINPNAGFVEQLGGPRLYND